MVIESPINIYKSKRATLKCSALFLELCLLYYLHLFWKLRSAVKRHLGRQPKTLKLLRFVDSHRMKLLYICVIILIHFMGILRLWSKISMRGLNSG